MKTETIAIGTVVGIAIVLLTVFLATIIIQGSRPSFETAHVINLDRDTKKLAKFMEQSTRPSKVERWTATYGKDLNAQALSAQGVGTIIVMSGKGTYTQQWKDLRNLGAVGCFLSHRALLHHCATLAVPDTAGHLILEDDAVFPKDFQEQWDNVRQRIPTDWDIVYLGMTGPKGHTVGKGISKLYTVKDGSGNWGTHAYIVRHGALNTKVLPALKRMFDAIDCQYNTFFDEWNVYAIEPKIVLLDDTMTSTIQTM